MPASNLAEENSMYAIEFQTTVKNGIIKVPAKYSASLGELVRVIVLSEEKQPTVKTLTAADLLQSNIIGIWADRDDIADSLEFARHHR
ncbi:MAG: hypothetical protein ACE5FD_09170 [Anaerolineae bacterium]